MRTLTLFLLTVGLLMASQSEDIASNKLTSRLEHKLGLVSLETKSGQTVRGLLERAGPSGLSVRTRAGAVQLPITDVRVVRLYEEVPARRLKSWRRHYRENARRSAGLIFSERTVLGLVYGGISAGAAAVSMPFCALGDLMMEVNWERPDWVYRVV